MPNIAKITAQVVSGTNVRSSGGAFHLVTTSPPDHEREALAPILAFVGEMRTLCDDYFESQEKTWLGEPRVTDYEDIAYLARQIDDGITSEYENPALLPLNNMLRAKLGLSLDGLKDVAAISADYVEDIVRSMLGRTPTTLKYLAPIVGAFQEEQITQLDLATLNHDLVVETALRMANVSYSDGFERPFGTLMIWNDAYSVSARRLLKLHGSIDWYRYNLRIDGWEGQVSARSDLDPFRPVGPAGEDLGYPAGGRPQILTGTFDKILRYPTGVYADQHFRFHEALSAADRLLVIGYGFRDKAINARIAAWAERPGERRMVVVHRDPDRVRAGSRGAIRNPWQRWQDRGLLAFVPKHLGGDVTWQEMWATLDPA